MIPSPIQFEGRPSKVEGRPSKGHPYDVKTGNAARGTGVTHISCRSFARRTVRLQCSPAISVLQCCECARAKHDVSCLPGGPKGGTISLKSMGDLGNAGRRRTFQIRQQGDYGNGTVAGILADFL